MKKLINAVEDVLTESLDGFAAAHADLVRVSHDPTFVARADAPVKGKVALISGGGSGHEPLHAGFVGHGMLDAACPGQVFTSPTPDQMLAAAAAVDGGAGVLFIVKNYAGDVMNFEMAAEMLPGEHRHACSPTTTSRSRTSTYTTGRRGVAGTRGGREDRRRRGRGGRRPGRLQGAGRPGQRGDRLDGRGAHQLHRAGRGQADLRRSATTRWRWASASTASRGAGGSSSADADAIADELIGAICDVARAQLRRARAAARQRLRRHAADGAVPDVPRRGAALAPTRGLQVARSLVGNYTTSLEMAGCSLTVTRLDDEMIALWDAPVHTPGLRWGR